VQTCVGDVRNCRLRPECLQASMGNTREKGKQEVKGVESGLIPCLFISCLKPIPKLELVLADDPYIYYLLAIGRLANAVATGVVAPEYMNPACTCTIVCKGLIA
jgi:hypothetical protein